MRVVGGLEIPGSRHGEIGAFVTEISPGGVVDTHGEVQEGDQVLEWNGIQLNSKSFEEVQSIISSTRGEVEIVICGYKSTTHAIPFLSSNRSRSYFLNFHQGEGQLAVRRVQRPAVYEDHCRPTRGNRHERK